MDLVLLSSGWVPTAFEPHDLITAQGRTAAAETELGWAGPKLNSLYLVTQVLGSGQRPVHTAGGDLTTPVPSCPFLCFILNTKATSALVVAENPKYTLRRESKYGGLTESA